MRTTITALTPLTHIKQRKMKATIALNKTFSVITENSVSTHQYSQFEAEINKLDEIILSASLVPEKQYRKYKAVIAESGFSLRYVQWYSTTAVNDGKNTAVTARVHFYKQKNN